jgi:hypothetical protein
MKSRREKLSLTLAVLLLAGVAVSSAGASHLRVRILLTTELVSTMASTSPEVWQGIAANLARDPYAIANMQFLEPAFSSTPYREIRVNWSLVCLPDGPPSVDHITYDFTAELRQSPGDLRLPLPGRILTPDGSGTSVLPVTAGTVVTVLATGWCGGWGIGPGSGGLHGAPRAEEHGSVIVVPPYMPLPAILVPSTSGKRGLNGPAGRYKLLRGRTLPLGKTVFLVPAVAMRLTGTQSVTIALEGAGVSVSRRVTADDVARKRPVVFRIRPKRRGAIRYWATLEPFKVPSNTVKLVVR